MSIRFAHSRAGVVQIGDDALAQMRAYEQHASDALEAGGLLLGRHLHNGHDIVVDLVSEPTDGDERTRFGFYRDAAGHQPVIDRAWETSGGTCAFLGDWHTHAEPSPTPSQIDRDNWARMLREDIVEDQACFFVIVGQAEIAVWEGDRRTGEISKLRAVP